MDFIFYSGDFLKLSFYKQIKKYKFLKYKDVKNDQWGKSHFNWTLDSGTNYHILRTGCFPYMKYHCSRRPIDDLKMEDYFFRAIKVVSLGKFFSLNKLVPEAESKNLVTGIPTVLYGIAAINLIKHVEYVEIPEKGKIPIFFLYEEDKGSMY